MSTRCLISRAGQKLFGIKDFTPQRIFTAYRDREPIMIKRSPLSRRYHEMLEVRARIEQGESMRDIAAERGVSARALARHLSLLSLPEEKRRLVERDDLSIRDWPIRDAIMEGATHERWLLLVKSLDSAERWMKLVDKGVSQAHIARQEGMTRARVCQLIRLARLDDIVKGLIRSGDARYYGVSLREVWG